MVDEGWRDFIGVGNDDYAAKKSEFNKILDNAEGKGIKFNRESILKQAIKNKFRGDVITVAGRLIYKNGASGLAKMAGGTSGGRQ